ncbi:MAG: hypothetical protein ABII06_22100 [Pseudomonadota bacterium]
METNVWIIVQVVIDVIMMCILFWFLKSHYKSQITWQNHEDVMHKSEAILSEMIEISHTLEGNLAEKKALSRDILEQLDRGLKRAEEAYQKISGIIPKSGIPQSESSKGRQDTEQTRFTVKALIEKGLSKGEISHHLGISVGEIDLLLKLQPMNKNAG